MVGEHVTDTLQVSETLDLLQVPELVKVCDKVKDWEAEVVYEQVSVAEEDNEGVREAEWGLAGDEPLAVRWEVMLEYDAV